MQTEPPEILSASFEDALGFVREQAGDSVLSSGESMVEHALGTAHIVEKLRVYKATLLAAVLFPLS